MRPSRHSWHRLSLIGVILLAMALNFVRLAQEGYANLALLLWTAWFLPQMAFFSVANLFHRYYLAMMAPAIAALVGAGVTAMWDDYCQRGGSTRLAMNWRGWLLPVALVVSAAIEIAILADFPDWSR